MGAVRDYFSAIGRTVSTLGDGLAVTFSYLLRAPHTVQYPDRIAEPLTKTLPDRSRGFLEVDMAICTGCGLCARTCPIDCIHFKAEKVPVTKERLILQMDIDLAKCMYCGLCVDACTTGSIRHSKDFEGTMANVQNLTVSFVDKPIKPAKVKKGTTPETRPLGEIIRERLPSAFAPARSAPAPLPVPEPDPAVVAKLKAEAEAKAKEKAEAEAKAKEEAPTEEAPKEETKEETKAESKPADESPKKEDTPTPDKPDTPDTKDDEGGKS